jgi:hypothetical protein
LREAHKSKSRTIKEGGPPILGGLFGVKPHYKKTITEEGRKRSGSGKTPEESQKNESKNWNKR